MKAPGVRLWTPLVVWLSACAVGPNFVRPWSEPSPSWGRLDEPGITAGETVETAVWYGFGDPILTELVLLATHANQDVRIAEARVREARGLRGVVRADLFPTITADGDYQREQRSKNQPFLGSLPIPRGPGDLFEAGFDATWEVDLWGRVRRSVEAADADQHAAEAERRDVLITIIAELAREYVELRGFQRQIEVTEKNVAIQRGLFELTRDLARAGLSTDVEVARAEAQVDATDSTLPT